MAWANGGEGNGVNVKMEPLEEETANNDYGREGNSNVDVKVELPEEDTENNTQGDGSEEVLSETEKKRRYLITANQRLRKGILTFKERQEILLDFIEVELGGTQEAIDRYLENKKRMMYVLGITDADLAEGRQNEKYVKLFRLMHLANAYWKGQKSAIHRPSNTESRLRFENNVPQELAELRLHVDFDSGMIGRKPLKRCQKCYDESHLAKECPYKRVEDRTPGITAMIQERMASVREEELKDPLLSLNYKRKHYKIDKDRWKNKKLKREAELREQL